jgi:hypothetical protein
MVLPSLSTWLTLLCSVLRHLAVSLEQVLLLLLLGPGLLKLACGCAWEPMQLLQSAM